MHTTSDCNDKKNKQFYSNISTPSFDQPYQLYYL